MQIFMTKKVYFLKDNTKTVYNLNSSETTEINEKELDYTASKEILKYLRKLGGSESLTMGYTCRGYRPIKLISYSPAKLIKDVRTFEYK